MLTLPLEPTDDRAQPAFKNPSTCQKWLDQLQFTNLSATQAALRAQLDEFNRFPMRGLDRMQTLELLRETVHYVQADFAKKLTGKPLPLNASELEMLIAITGLWQSMVVGYQRCLQTYQAGDKHLAAYGALLCHRCLTYSGLQIFEYLRAGYEFDGELWRQFHALYAFIEEQGLLPAEVQDELGGRDRITSCRYTYLKTLLACHARPQELTRPQQQLLDRWLSQWIAAITIDRRCTISRGDAPPLAMDLNGTLGLQPIRQDLLNNDNVRFLAMVPISKLLRVKTILLQQGHTPQQLELGEGNNSDACIELLTHLHKYWCEPRPQRMEERHRVAMEMQLCYGLENIYSCVANKPFNPFKKSDTALREIWHAEDVSVLGARLVRHNTTGARLSANQIIAVHNAETNTYQAGSIVWIGVMRAGQLHMGIRFLPGTLQALSIKPVVPATDEQNKPTAALLLSALSDMDIPPSLLIPRYLFQPDRLLESTLPNNEKKRYKLRFSVEAGVDYERVGFAAG